MKKSNRVQLDFHQIERIVNMAQEEKKPFEAIKLEFGLSESEVSEIMKKRLSRENFELWRKKATSSKPKLKPMIDDFDDELDFKYYIKNKLD